MRVMLDTNILISMIFFPSPITESFKHELIKHEIVLCDYVIKEIQLVTERKFPGKVSFVDGFFAELPYDLIYTPKNIISDQMPSIRDGKDAPILATALSEGIDYFVTGDKDFLILKDEIDSFNIVNMREFIMLFI